MVQYNLPKNLIQDKPSHYLSNAMVVWSNNYISFVASSGVTLSAQTPKPAYSIHLFKSFLRCQQQ
jgi:hypothetical protein